MYLTKIINWRGVLSLAIVPWVLLTIGFAVQQPPAPMTASAQLDFEFFKTQVQPIFLAKRPGRARCVACHTTGTPMRLQPLSPGSATWDEGQSRQNFEVVRQRVIPSSLQSKLLLYPLVAEAGGDGIHSGGKHWDSQKDPEWQTLAAWVRGNPGGQVLTVERTRAAEGGPDRRPEMQWQYRGAWLQLWRGEALLANLR